MRECPYCLSPVGDGEEITNCEHCGAVHHAECWKENGGCAAKDCRGRPSRLTIDVPPSERERLVLSREAVESARPRRAPKFGNPCIRCGRQVPEGELHCPDCKPEHEESPDSRNIGPILMMLAVLGVLLAWLVVGLLGSSPNEPAPSPTEARSRMRQ
jgi:predicted nucleic acid-binding Zn ribbon protein